MGALGVLLLPLAGAAWAALFWRRDGDLLDASLKASLVFVWTAFALSEVLGALHLLSAGFLFAGWSLSLVPPLFMLPRLPQRAALRASAPSPTVLVCLCLALCIALITLCMALGQPQWNMDVQLYHLPRVEQWVQNRSLALFPTPYDLQDFFPPGAEYLTLQFRLLFGSAALAALGQWSAFVLGATATAAIARTLGAKAKGQALTVLLWAALPMAVLQSSTAQSDLAAAYGAALTAYFALRHDQAPGGHWDLWTAAAVGAALMLKGTDYLFVPCFGIWVALRRDWRRPQFSRLTLLVLLAATPSVPYWARNVELVGSPLGTSSMHFIKGLGPASLASNSLKALGDELRVPSLAVNAAVVKVISEAHAWAKLPWDEPGWVFNAKTPYDFYAPQRAAWHEDYAGAPLQTLAFLALLAAFLIRPKRRPWRYLAACLGGAVLYLALVRWNIWDTRLHLPFYATMVPLLGLELGQLRRPILVWAMVTLFGVQGLWAACADQGHPLTLLFSRARTEATLQIAVPGIVPGVQAALRGNSIGLLEVPRCCPEHATCEYGVWAGAHSTGRMVHIEHLSASPATAHLLALPPWDQFRPNVIVADAHSFTTTGLDWDGHLWRRLGSDGTWVVYLPVNGDLDNRLAPAPSASK